MREGENEIVRSIERESKTPESQMSEAQAIDAGEDKPESLLNLTPPEEPTSRPPAGDPALGARGRARGRRATSDRTTYRNNFGIPRKETNVDAMAQAYRELRKKWTAESTVHKYDTSQVEALEADGRSGDGFPGTQARGLDELTKFYLDAQSEIADKIETSRAEEMSKLGRNADGIIKSMDAWLMKFHSSKVLNDSELEAIANASSNAAFISAMNKIRKSYNEPDIERRRPGQVAPASMADIEELMRDPKYGPIQFTQKVERMVYEMHGEKYLTRN